MIKKLVLALLLAAIGFVFYVYSYLGVNRDVKIQTVERGPLILLYKNHMGAYHQIQPTITAVEDWAQKNNLLCPKTFGEFLDDPKAMDQDRLRSHAGCVLLSPLPETPAELSYEEKPPRRYVVAQFEGAPSVGPFAVYPKVTEYIEKNRLKWSGQTIEIYTVNGSQVSTEYLFPID